MKHWKLLLATLVVSSVMVAQEERVLLTPSGEAIPVEKGKSALQIALKKAGLPQPDALLLTCVDRQPVGNIPGPIGVNFGFFHGDVSAMVYIAPFAGVIESVYFLSFGAVGIPDSSCAVRIMAANTAGFGPPARHMGAWTDATDPDVGRTPYEDLATGPYLPGADANYSPVGLAELWGLGGFPATWHTGQTVTGIRMLDLGYEPPVATGDTFIICVRLPAAHIPTGDRTEMSGSTPPVEPYRFFKYYHHDRGAAGTFGWWSREFDMYIWCVIRATANVPPNLVSVTTLHNTASQGPFTVTMTAFDCNPDSSNDTGVVSATLSYKVGGGGFTDVPMTFVPGTGWQAAIPGGQPLDSTITYHVSATDNHGLTSTSDNTTFRIVRFSRDSYLTTVPATFNWIDITTTGGTEIAGGDWFNPDPDNEPSDDGTAGPFGIGGSFSYFTQSGLTTAWIGVNGGLALVSSATETVYVSSSGGFFFTPALPGTAPKNFIAGFWNDLLVVPGYPTFPGHGSVWYKVDGSKFIVQWNRVGNFNDLADTTTTFQIILDRADSSITFQYLDVGTTGLELQGSLGLQDSGLSAATRKWVFLNQSGYPTETRPANNSAIKLKLTPLVGVVERGDGIPAKFALHANYPNPFNPTTSISYDLAARSKVELTIYNLLGEKIAELVNGEQAAGGYRATWDGRNANGQTVASGVYFYKLSAGNFLSTKKMVLLK